MKSRAAIEAQLAKIRDVITTLMANPKNETQTVDDILEKMVILHALDHEAKSLVWVLQDSKESEPDNVGGAGIA